MVKYYAKSQHRQQLKSGGSTLYACDGRRVAYVFHI
jgi:hypothetical protein